MDFDTRDRYRKIVENLALATDCSELEVARAAIELAQRNSIEHERRTPAGNLFGVSNSGVYPRAALVV